MIEGNRNSVAAQRGDEIGSLFDRLTALVVGRNGVGFAAPAGADDCRTSLAESRGNASAAPRVAPATTAIRSLSAL
jgi:hypothetical protein